MRILFTTLTMLIHILFMPITFALSMGVLLGAYVIGRQLRPARTFYADGELGAHEWLGLPRAEWLGV